MDEGVMAIDDLDSWMWAEAVRRQEQADRIQRQFFKKATHQPRRQWEPPVDIFETTDAIYVIVALPGVSDATLSDLEVRGDTLYVAGQRQVPTPGERAVLHRLEIPHGHFERAITLPWPRLTIAGHELTDGCLYLTLAKR
ncbi:Hsp20/alpha crystallin family protein [Salinisphaera sp. Q1T1-3]|uniref:Hsp20/alpha crystallin family protein n=1 Tax=Salinisphaera sp. Q1T1-3 TaxID=2321229 RepID=UPI000E734D84|nr:Hsp20/alpha crystallin family protein [Salinisphaera sp. Q1T1-3]RJS91033.1 Hsp20/alpha crystallin family protein [Salinisphaera sp. Q1T1-3]